MLFLYSSLVQNSCSMQRIQIGKFLEWKILLGKTISAEEVSQSHDLATCMVRLHLSSVARKEFKIPHTLFHVT
ncbi:hypothetical protein Tsubulata_023597 [Turnera subulata]|uniref:Uncharacterized protein n=1 Tax=Turnera subulata TaxID=218843 RepID=A0A9Q0G0W6_9ROSI|nr:hypothetical protein Tsubulata_023597 [Turnera subulata]